MIIYIIFVENYPMAISEEKSDLYDYIHQFNQFFSTTQYEVRVETQKSNFYLTRYRENILHRFTNRVILTDKEISYYSKMYFYQIYEDTLEKIFRIMYDPRILKMENSEKINLIRKNEKYYDMYYKDYETFLDYLDNKGELLEYITEPLMNTMLY